MSLDEKSLSSIGILAKDVLLVVSRSSGIFAYWLSLQVIINWSQSSTYTRQVGIDDIGMRYLITTDGSMESQEIVMIYQA